MAEDFKWADLVPELGVSNITASRVFWCEIIGFEVHYERPEEGFAYLNLDGAQLMLVTREDTWVVAEMEPPFGRGVNFSIWMDDLAPVLDRIKAAGLPLFREQREYWRRQDDHQEGSIEFLIQDPDGYLLRISKELGARPLEG